jgi:uncharacterized protein (DUF1330 family)
MTAYWINTFTAIHDEARLARYVELAVPALRAAGGVFLARGPVHVLEGSAALRASVIRFDSADAAVAAYHSRAYQEALAEHGNDAERDTRIVNAVVED